jgi:hypothetical protein
MPIIIKTLFATIGHKKYGSVSKTNWMMQQIKKMVPWVDASSAEAGPWKTENLSSTNAKLQP